MNYHGLTEDEFTDLLKEIVRGYGYRYSFTYQTAQDVEQQAYIEAIEGLKEYRAEKGNIKHFLRVHVRNRLQNDKRKRYARNDIPCKNCPLAAYVCEKCTAFVEPETECQWLAPWLERNETRKKIASPISIDEIDPLGESQMAEHRDPGEKIEMGEIWELIERDIPDNLKSLYNIWKTGYREGHKRKTKLTGEQLLLVENFIRERVGYLFV